MLRAIGCMAIGLIGCKHKFDRVPDAAVEPSQDAPADTSADAPPVPAAICNVDRIDIGPTSKVVDLATTSTSTGYAAVWIDNGATSGITLGPLGFDRRHPVMARGSIDAPRSTQLTGLAAVNQRLLITTTDGTDLTALVLDDSFPGTTSQTLVLPGHVAGHYPFPSGATGEPLTLLSANGDTFELRTIANDGTISAAAARMQSTEGGAVMQFACDDWPDHGHCTWVEAAGAASECKASDVFSSGPTMLLPFIADVAPCRRFDAETRIATDSVGDLMAVVTTTSQGLEAHWLHSPEDEVVLITAAGSAPRIRFNGKDVFWLAWLDVDSVLHLSSLDTSISPPRIVSYPLRGWSPSTPAAFELVARRAANGLALEIGLALISEGSRYLDFLSICL